MRGIVPAIVGLAVCLLIGTHPTHAQFRDLDDSGQSWRNRISVGVPDDDESDDENDDEGSDCPTYPASVPQTGQSKCWNSFGFSIDCAGTGQDGEYQAGLPAPDPRFTDNGDGTITDNFTGLKWLQDANCFGNILWLDALIAANDLSDGSCGLSDGSLPGDWKLPNVRELHSLIEYDRSTPALPSDHPFLNIPDLSFAAYWTSTSARDSEGHAWVVSSLGSVILGIKFQMELRVWPVRHEP